MIRIRPSLAVCTGCLLVGTIFRAWAGPQTKQAVLTQPPVPQRDILPPFPPAKSPVDLFRELLAMSPSERRQALTNRPPEVQKQILAKVREYQVLKADERELRLQATELRYFLLPILSSPATNRAAELARVPDQTRKLVVVRLRQWDALAPEVRQELLDNEAAIRYFTEAVASPQEPRTATTVKFTTRSQKLEASLDRWHALSESERQKIEQRFHTFFELSLDERGRILGSLSAVEKQQIEKTLKSFEGLPPPQRSQCIRAFNKFANLSAEERLQFLKNAERWKLMSPQERQEWRDLVSHLATQPPLPPGAAPGVSIPPIPQPTSRSLATNGHLSEDSPR
jgi:hypothetical protein